MGNQQESEIFDDPVKDLEFRYTAACRVWGEAKRGTESIDGIVIVSALSIIVLPLLLFLAEGQHAALDFRVWLTTVGACSLTLVWRATHRRRERRLERRVHDLEYAIDAAGFEVVSVGSEERSSMMFEALLRKRPNSAA